MINNDFDIIMEFAHWQNWLPDWEIVKNIYNTYPNSYSILTPFAYSYLEEIIRSTTSEYGKILFNEDGTIKKHRKVGLRLIDLAIKENEANVEYLEKLEDAKTYFKESSQDDAGDNRNSVDHGFMHSSYWTKESFENLIHFIAKISKFSQF